MNNQIHNFLSVVRKVFISLSKMLKDSEITNYQQPLLTPAERKFEVDLNNLQASVDNLQASINTLQVEINMLTETAKLTPSEKLPDKVTYDAAVDAWIYINNHLFTLGKDRFKIPHVYALLAGHQVNESELKDDLVSLNENRREEVITIIVDIKQFKTKHLASLEIWLSNLSGRTYTLQDAVRFPLGQPFDNELDEDLLGDSVSDGEKITKVAALGYLFPGSLNGSYRVKSKVLI